MESVYGLLIIIVLMAILVLAAWKFQEIWRFQQRIMGRFPSAGRSKAPTQTKGIKQSQVRRVAPLVTPTRKIERQSTSTQQSEPPPEHIGAPPRQRSRRRDRRNQAPQALKPSRNGTMHEEEE
ncbi:MAG: hypothetical protein EXR62_10990 [Chloroflexi bacterium]|nr:hypothetical protein [Chloroflexota bacterium]